MNAMNATRVLIAGLAIIGAGLIAPASQATVPGQNGKLLVGKNDGGSGSLALVNPFNGAVHDIPSSTSNYDPSFSPDGRSIAFISNPGDQLHMKRLSGGPIRALTDDDFSYVGSPVFAPDGKSVLYTETYGEIEPYTEVKEVSLDGNGRAQIDTAKFAFGLNISPDGKLVTYSEPSELTCIEKGCYYRTSEILVMNRDGSGVRSLVDGLAASSPSFSPDGKRIAFTGQVPDGTADGQIYSVALDGTDLIKLTDGPRRASWPVYSPDGRKIAYSTPNHLVVMNADGSDPRNVAPATVGTVADWQRKAPFVIRKMPPKRRVLQVNVFGPGRLTVSGRLINGQIRRVSSAGTVRVPIRPDSVMKKRLAAKGKASTKVKVTFEPKGALPSTIKQRLILKRRG